MHRCRHGLHRGLLVLIGAILLGAPCRAQSYSELQQLDRGVFELIRARKNPEAALVAQQAVDKAAEEFGPTHPELPWRLDVLGFALRIQRRFDEAEIPLQRSLSMREELFGKDHPVVCYSLTNLAVLYEARGRMDAIEAPLRRCLRIYESVFGPQHPVVAHTLHHIGKVYREQGRVEEALALGERAIAILGHAHPAALMVLIEEGKHEQAALVLGIGKIPPGDRAATEAAVRSTFFGKVDRVRWTNFIMDREQDPQVLSIAGEATHHNKIWQSFQVELAREDSTWKIRKVRAMPLAWFD